jgi:hypothetical protein
MSGSPVGRVEEGLEAGGKGRGEFGGPGLVDEADVDEVAEVGAVFVAEGGELDLDEDGEREDAERAHVLGIGGVGIGRGFVRADEFVGEDEVDGVAGARGWAVEEEVELGVATMGEASEFEGGLGGREVGAVDEDVNIRGVADGGLVDGGDPGGDGVSANHGVGDAGGVKGFGGAEEALADLFDGVDHPVNEA